MALARRAAVPRSCWNTLTNSLLRTGPFHSLRTQHVMAWIRTPGIKRYRSFLQPANTARHGLDPDPRHQEVQVLFTACEYSTSWPGSEPQASRGTGPCHSLRTQHIMAWIRTPGIKRYRSLSQPANTAHHGLDPDLRHQEVQVLVTACEHSTSWPGSGP